MIRPVAEILAALQIAAPNFPHKAEAAVQLRDLSSANGHDPLTLIEVVRGESRWQPGAISHDGSYGLAQIRAINFKECRNPVDVDKCEARKASLLDWRYNLTIASGNFRHWREYCKKTVGSGLFVHWHAGFAGYDHTRGTTCGHVKRRGKWVALEIPALTKKVLKRRRELAEAVR